MDRLVCILIFFFFGCLVYHIETDIDKDLGIIVSLALELVPFRNLQLKLRQ